MLQLAADTALRLPGVTVLKASAGSGKTYTLTARCAQFLLSRRVPRNELRNLLAITFANNASREMRQEVLAWLKRLARGDPGSCADMTSVVVDSRDISEAAGEVIERVLSRFSEFQVRTIDSFMSMVFRASALDFGYDPEFQIVLEQEPLIDYAFTLFLREAREGSERAALLDSTLRSLLAFRGDGSYPWDPARALRDELRALAEVLASLEQAPILDDREEELAARQQAMRAALERVNRLVEGSGLESNAGSTFPRLLESARAGRFSDLLGVGSTPPVRKPRKRHAGQDAAWEAVIDAWAEAREAADALASCWARAWYDPLLRLHAGFSDTLEAVKRSQGTVFIGDIGRTLARSLSQDIVPEIYFRLGERIWHFLVDEFQDTSPLQWHALFPLVENSLAAGGTLFAVGDTKQAIYGFREADYRIMKELEARSPFPSAPLLLDELTVNRRSRPRVIELAAEVFRRRAATLPDYAEAARRTGLDSWKQEAEPGEDPGYAEVRILQRNDDDPPEREMLLETLRDASTRGYRWGDMALLASRNEEIVRATSWLNENGIPFLSYSSLDVRSRRVAQELLALLSFLDSPPDDLAFATFLLGGIFAGAAAGRPGFEGGPAALHEVLFRARRKAPLYKAFQDAYPRLWKELFAGLFRAAGYLPLYDLVSEAFARFAVFDTVPGEEATLAKLLEAVKDFEGTGGGSLRAFLTDTAGDAAQWAIEVPRGVDSVRAMTVHKAKGLGFPVVIALLYGGGARAANAGVLEGSGAPRLVRVTADVAARDAVVRRLRDADLLSQRVDSLNALYVALTRARRELYVIGVRRGEEKFPFDLLPTDSFAPDSAGRRRAPAAPGGEPAERLSHDLGVARLEFAGAGALSREERRRGERAHRMLELVGAFPPDLPGALRRAAVQAAAEAREDRDLTEALVPALVRLVQATELAGCFSPAEGRVVFTEQEFCDSAGTLSRMDRVVVDPALVTVIDFKTGAEEPAQHEAQLRSYMAVLSEVYPGRPVRGIIGYVDRGTARSLS